MARLPLLLPPLLFAMGCGGPSSIGDIAAEACEIRRDSLAIGETERSSEKFGALVRDARDAGIGFNEILEAVDNTCPIENLAANTGAAADVGSQASGRDGSEQRWLERIAEANSRGGVISIDDLTISANVLRVYTDARDDGQAAGVCFDVRASGWDDHIEVWGQPGPMIRAWTGASNTGCIGYSLSTGNGGG